MSSCWILWKSRACVGFSVIELIDLEREERERERERWQTEEASDEASAVVIGSVEAAENVDVVVVIAAVDVAGAERRRRRNGFR